MGEATSSCQRWQSPLSLRVRVNVTLKREVVSLEDSLQIVWEGIKMKKVLRRKPWLWHAEPVLILSNLGICCATFHSDVSYFFSVPVVLSPVLFLYFHLLLQNHLYLSLPPFFSSHPSPHAYLYLVSVSPLPWHDNKSQGLRGSCLRWGVIICTVCKLSGHDELAALNRPLLTDTDGGMSISHH